jgi:serine/threonine protein kinase
VSLAVGDKLGPYDILAPIGAGGMGEAWKARDTRLGRIVAIKRLSAINPWHNSAARSMERTVASDFEFPLVRPE